MHQYLLLARLIVCNANFDKKKNSQDKKSRPLEGVFIRINFIVPGGNSSWTVHKINFFHLQPENPHEGLDLLKTTTLILFKLINVFQNHFETSYCPLVASTETVG